MDTKKQKIINILLYILVILVIYCVMRPFFVDFTLYGDSASWNWYSEKGFWQPFLQNDHSWFIFSPIFCMCNRFLPLMFNVHPQMFYKYFYWIVIFGVYVAFFFAIRENFTKYFNPKYAVLWTLPIFPIVLQALDYGGFKWAPMNDSFSLSYILLPLFFILFANSFEKIYVKNLYPETSLRERITLLVLFIFVSCSHEFPRFIICLGLYVGYYLHKWFVNNDIDRKKYWAIYKGILIFNLVLFLTPNFRNWFGERDNHLTLRMLISDFPNMVSAYFQTVIVENWLYFAVLAVMLIALKFIVKNLKEKRKLFVWTASILVSIFAFSMVIIVGSETYEYSFMHPGIRFLDKIFLLNLIFSIAGYIFSYDCSIKKKVAVLVLCFAPLLLGVKKDSLDYSYQQQEIYQSRYRAYLLERFFILHEKPAKVYYQIKDKVFFEKNSLRFYLFFHDRGFSQQDYVEKTLCEPTDEFEDCNKKIMDILKNEHNFEFSKEELEKLDFNIYKKDYDF